MGLKRAYGKSEPASAPAQTPSRGDRPPHSPVPLPVGVTPGGPELWVGSAADTAEVDADREADRALARLSRSETSPGTDVGWHRHDPSCGHLRRAPDHTASASVAVGPAGGALPAGAAEEIERLRPAGEPLAPSVRRRMEEGFGQSFAQVRIHDDDAAARISEGISAQAFTTGRDIFFGRGRYAPETAQGARVLAHELAHTLQPDQHVRRPVAGSGRAVRSEHGASVRRAFEVTGSDGKTTFSSKKIDLPSKAFSAHQLKVGPPDLNRVLVDAMTTDGYETEDIRLVVAALNDMHATPGTDGITRYASWRAAFDVAARAAGTDRLIAERRESATRKEIERRAQMWPAAAEHRERLTMAVDSIREQSRGQISSLLEKVQEVVEPALRTSLEAIVLKNFRDAGGSYTPGQDDGRRLDRFEVLAKQLLLQRPPEQWIYVICGNSLVASGIYLQQLCPDADVINLAASNVGEFEATGSKARHDDYQPFYHSQFAGHLDRIKGGRRLLLVDYSKKGKTLRLLREGVANYLTRVGLPPDNVETFGFDSATITGSGDPTEMGQLVKDLENEVMKAAGAVLFDKKSWTKFTGDISDPQAACLGAYVGLWNAISARLKQKSLPPVEMGELV